jgi:hypothetical protein
MGLDMYAYVAAKAEQEIDSRELAYWRKHPHLHGWMEQLWQSRGNLGAVDVFNGVELELFREDIDRLEQDIQAEILPETRGFFFGDDASEYYRLQDLEFVKTARAELFLGLRVFYNSSW